MEDDENIIEVPSPEGIGHLKTEHEMLTDALPPIERLRHMSDKSYEDFILEWVHGYLKKKSYIRVVRSGGAGDMGRDIIAYINQDEWDNYQCKYYANALTPSDLWLEFGKLCYYTFIKKFTIPKNYFLIAPQGVGNKLRLLLDNPDELRKGLIAEWNDKCKSEISKKVGVIELEGDLLKHVEAFDFSIISEVTPLEILDQHMTTPWFGFRFGLIHRNRPKPTIPDSQTEENHTNYVKQLFSVYSEFKGSTIDKIEQLDSFLDIKQHFSRQRMCFHWTESLYRYAIEISPEAIDAYSKLKSDLYEGVIEVHDSIYKSGYERLQATLSQSCTVEIKNNILGPYVDIKDRKGMCHHLADSNQLIWVK
jgi:hypothetical protein